jgi:hypothetical protein
MPLKGRRGRRSRSNGPNYTHGPIATKLMNRFPPNLVCVASWHQCATEGSTRSKVKVIESKVKVKWSKFHTRASWGHASKLMNRFPPNLVCVAGWYQWATDGSTRSKVNVIESEVKVKWSKFHTRANCLQTNEPISTKLGMCRRLTPVCHWRVDEVKGQGHRVRSQG